MDLSLPTCFRCDCSPEEILCTFVSSVVDEVQMRKPQKYAKKPGAPIVTTRLKLARITGNRRRNNALQITIALHFVPCTLQWQKLTRAAHKTRRRRIPHKSLRVATDGESSRAHRGIPQRARQRQPGLLLSIIRNST